jgi:transcription antitermination factor NusG
MTEYYPIDDIGLPIEAPPIRRMPRVIPDHQWYIIQVRPKCEEKVIKRIAPLNYDAYYPVQRYWSKRDKRTNKMKKLTGPLIKGYIFIRMPTANAPFELIRQYDGVNNFIRVQGTPLALKESEIKFLRERELAGEFDQTKRRRGVRNDRAPFPEWLIESAEVVIRSGPFINFIGIVQEALSHTRIKVRTAIFGSIHDVELSLAQLRPAHVGT